MSNEFDYGDLERIEIPVTGPDKKAYTLKEATGGAAKKYRNHLLSSTTFNSEGKPVAVKNVADLEPMLVSFCLYDAKTGQPVPQTRIESWPARVQKALYEKAKDISDLGEKPAGNEALDSLLAALDTEGAPVSSQTLKEWARTLGDDFEPIRSYLQETPEEAAKNELVATTQSSDSPEN